MMDQFKTSLQSLAALMFTRSPLILSDDEFLAAFIEPSHLPMLKEVQEMCRPGLSAMAYTMMTSAEGDGMQMQIQFGVSAPVILPQYIRHGLQPTCPQAVRDKFDAWMAERVNFGRAFGDAHDALEYLNDNCGDVEAMTLMLPCLPSIMSNTSEDGDSKAVKKAQQLTSIKRFGKLPRIPRQVTQRLSEVSALINATTLMKDAPVPDIKRHYASFSLKELTASTRTNIFYQNAEPNTPVPVASFL
jgi:hypothetical protein